MVEYIAHAIQDEYPDSFSHCFGCGRLNDSGYKFRTGWHGERTITVYTHIQAHQAKPNFLYGGLIASLIDCHGTGSASFALTRHNSTESCDVVESPLNVP